MEETASKPSYEGVWAGDIVETVHGPGTVSSVAEGRCWIDLPQHSLRWSRPVSDVQVVERAPAIERKQTIKSIAEKRGIKFLAHFTRIENLPGILKFGMLPRAHLATVTNAGLQTVVTDEERFDLCTEATSLSISFPNYLMFYRHRQDVKEAAWAVLKFNPAILWEKDCAFCVENAASLEARKTSIEARKDPEALERFFQDYHNSQKFVERRTLNLSTHFPTNPQAEVLVFGSIELQWLLQVCFEYPEHLKKSCFGGDHSGCSVPLAINRNLYRPRKDHQFWKAPPMVPHNEAGVPLELSEEEKYGSASGIHSRRRG